MGQRKEKEKESEYKRQGEDQINCKWRGIYREEQYLWASAKGAKAVGLPGGQELRNCFLYQNPGSQERGRSPQLMTWQREPYPTYSSLKVEMSTVLSCQIVLNPRYSHP